MDAKDEDATQHKRIAHLSNELNEYANCSVQMGRREFSTSCTPTGVLLGLQSTALAFSPQKPRPERSQFLSSWMDGVKAQRRALHLRQQLNASCFVMRSLMNQDPEPKRGLTSTWHPAAVVRDVDPLSYPSGDMLVAQRDLSRKGLQAGT